MQLNIDHEFRNLIPPLANEEYEQLESNILKDGCRDPLVAWGDTLIDGHNRYGICTANSMPFKIKYMDFKTRKDAIEWIILNQFGRRNLPNYERAKLAIRLKPVIAERAKENLKIYGGNQHDIAPCQKSDNIHIKTNTIDTKKELAKIAGVSHDTIAKVEKIEEKGTPEIKEKLARQEISINQAYQQTRKEEKIKVVEEIIEDHKEVQTGVIDIFDTDRKYNIIYADPAWSYWDGGQKNQSLHYSTMSMDDIKSLPVSNVADDNCILFLWVTYPILKESLEVIESWGFKYSTCGFVWVKKNKGGEGNFFGLGSWTRANTELCLIATKGSVLRMDASISQVIDAPIDEHSKKPAITRSLITRLVGELPRIELFSRNKTDGWDVWGNQA